MKNATIFRVAIVGYVLVLCGLIAAYISVSLVHVKVSAYIQGPVALIQGGPNAIRGFIMDAPTGRLFSDAQTSYILNPGASQVIAGAGKTEKHGYVHTVLDVSTAVAGPQTLKVVATHPLIKEFEAETSVDVVEPAPTTPWLKFTSRGTEDTKSAGKKGDKNPEQSDWTGTLRVEALSPHVELIRGLANSVAFRAVDLEGRPVPAKIEFTKVEGPIDGPLPETLETDEFGLFTLEFKPVGGIRWGIKVTSLDTENPAEGAGDLTYLTVAAQFNLKMQQNFVTPGEIVEGQVNTLHRNGGLLVDLYADDRWVFAGAYAIGAQGAGLRAHAPGSVKPKLWRVQVYEDVFEPGNAWDSKWVAVSRDGTCRSAIDPTLSLLAENPRHTNFVEGFRTKMLSGPPMPEPRCNQLLGELLQGFETHFVESTLLINSQPAAEADLDTWKSEVKSWLVILIGIALFVAFTVVMFFVAQGVAAAQHQRRMMEEVDFDLEGDGLQSPTWDRIAHIARVIILIGTVALFCVGLVMVLKLM